jgi:ABC-type glutathione transport system ATPase component
MQGRDPLPPREFPPPGATEALLVSHDPAEVPQFSSDIIVIRAGHVLERERTQDVLPDPQHQYTGSPLDSAVELTSQEQKK